jgi:predicted MPP superfamily phosphohydrolase
MSLSAAAVIGLTGVALAGYAGLVEPRLLTMPGVTVRTHRWLPGWPPLRIAILADLHAAWPHVTAARLGSIARRIVAADPDIVVLPGDFVSTRTPGVVPLAIEAVARALAPLAAAVPSFAVLGNHDYDLGGRRVHAALEEVGIEVLHNRARPMAWAGGALWLAGVGCMRSGRADLRSAMRDIPEEGPAILLSHIPDIFPKVSDAVVLTVAGHTHGGQVRLPLVGPLVTMSRLPRHMTRGLHAAGGRHLYVSSGIGTSGLPIRFGVRPEVAMLTLQGAGAP